MKVKLDANLGTRGARLLIARGHDVRTADEQQMSCASDEVLIAACTAEGRALISLDTDFANSLRYPPARHAGVVALRMLTRTTIADIEAALDVLLAAVGDGALTGRLIIVDHLLRVREYRPFQA